MSENYSQFSLAELKKIAKEKNIRGYSSMNKDALLSALSSLSETPKVKKDSEKKVSHPEKKSSGKKTSSQKPSTSGKESTSDKESTSAKTSASDHTKSSVKKSSSETTNEIKTPIPPKPEENIGAGILEVLADGYGFIRSNDIYYPGDHDIYVAKSQILRFNMRTGDFITGMIRERKEDEKYAALLRVDTINGMSVLSHETVTPFDKLTPVFPKDRLRLEFPGCETSMRIVDLLSPIGKGQRGMIVAQPKVGKTTLLKQIAKSLQKNHPELHIIILLIDERPEEVTDMKNSIRGENVEIVYSTFDELPDHHKRISEIVIERAKRLVETGRDVLILLDSITRLTRAYNLTCTSSGRTLSGGLDPAALYMPKKFFGSARAMQEGGSLTILATALLETGSRLDDVVYEEFKGTGNMELVLNRKLSERRIFPAIDILKSSTRRDDLLLSDWEMSAVNAIRKATGGLRPEEVTEEILNLFENTNSNQEFIIKLSQTLSDL